MKGEKTSQPYGCTRFLRTGLLLSVLFNASSCSSRGWFDWGKQVGEGKADCEALVSVSERRKCEESFDLDYERYEEEKARIDRDKKGG